MSVIPEHLAEALQLTALFAEAHSIKGLLAIDRLDEALKFSPKQIKTFLSYYEVLHAPRSRIAISDALEWNMEELAQSRLQRLIDGAVFPVAYSAGREWIRRHGFSNLVESFRERAILRMGYLGHSWTIWCSFHEIEPYLKTEKDRVLAGERFVEFCATELSTPDWTYIDSIEENWLKLTVSEEQAIQAILNKPGFLGHRLISLSYLLKYKHVLTEQQWQHGIERTYRESLKTLNDPANDIKTCFERPCEERADQLDILTAIRQFLEIGSKEVHTLTLADAVLQAWKQLGPEHRVSLTSILETYGKLQIKRNPSGERDKKLQAIT